MTPETPNPETTPRHAADVVCADVLCTICGYNLRGLPGDAACPECAAPVARSRQGDLLCYADPAWLRGVDRGATLFTLGAFVLVSTILLFVGLSVLVLQSGRPALVTVVTIILQVLVIVGPIIMLVGAILLTRQEPRSVQAEQPSSSRRLARGGMLGVIVGIGLASVPTTPPLLLSLLKLGIAACFLIALLGSLGHVEALSTRIPDDKLRRQSRRRRVALLIVGVIFLISIVLAVVLPAAAGPGRGMFKLLGCSGFAAAACVLSAVSIITRLRPALNKVKNDARATGS